MWLRVSPYIHSPHARGVNRCKTGPQVGMGKHAPLWSSALGVLQMATGVLASAALLCLAVLNMRVHERTHVRCGLVFFLANWLQVRAASAEPV